LVSDAQIRGKKLKMLRISRGLTRWELAAASKVSERWIMELERGRASTPKTMKRLLEALGRPYTDRYHYFTLRELGHADA